MPKLVWLVSCDAEILDHGAKPELPLGGSAHSDIRQEIRALPRHRSLPPLASCVTLGKSLGLSVPLLPPLQNGGRSKEPAGSTPRVG